MTQEADRPRFIERGESAQTPEEVRRRRSTSMLVFGGIALAWALLGIASGSLIPLLIGVLGVGLLVGGLVIR